MNVLMISRTSSSQCFWPKVASDLSHTHKHTHTHMSVRIHSENMPVM